jgi:putative membrane protein
MGAADLVPGVSGGTMALILGIYPRLIVALGSLTRADAWRALLGGRPREAWRAVDGTFLASLAVGIAVAVAGLSRLLHAVLEAWPVGVYAVFFGLIAASAWIVVRRIRGRRRVALAFAVAGAVAAFTLVGATPAATPDTRVVLAASGALAVSALLLPGVSGAFVLVLLGKYETVLAALSRLDVAVLAPLATGMAVGLLAFSRLLAAALSRWPTPVLGTLAGFLLGSLRKVWPWQRIDGQLSVATLPPGPGEAAVVAVLTLVAAAAVVALDRMAGDDRPPGRAPRAGRDAA